VLRALAIIYVIGAGLAAAAAVLSMGYILIAARFAWTDKLIMFVGALAAGFFLVVSMLAIAEVLKLFIDMEHNTRMSAVGHMGIPATVATMPPADASSGLPAAAAATATPTDPDGQRFGGRLHTLDEETAEAALLRGH
jgi:hypothetical protein